jgi:hypothetical protein
MRQEGSLATLAELLATNRISEALEVVEAAIGRFAGATNTVFIGAGESTAGFIGGALNVIIDFDQVNTRAVNIMRQNRFRLVTQFTQDQARATRAALVDGITRGLNPLDQARNFRSSIGLTERQVEAVNNYRRLLRSNSSESLTRQLRDRRFDGSVRRSISTGEALSDAQIDRMVGRYNERSLVFRSEVIARTEALRAVHEGSDEMFAQAFESGDLNPEQVIQQWLTASDGLVREPAHTFMHLQERRVGVPFDSGIGNQLRFPGDASAPAKDVVMCRCVVTTRITSIAA